MSMTRSDYQAVALVIGKAYKYNLQNPNANMVKFINETMKIVLKGTNPRFNENIWDTFVTKIANE